MLDLRRIASFVQQRGGSPPKRIQHTPLPGGFENGGVFKLTLTSGAFVLKRLVGSGVRELAIYEALGATSAAGVLPRLLGSERLGAEEAYLYLEFLPREDPWPWRHKDASIAVLEQLAKVHALPISSVPAAGDWDYEAELRGSAQATVELFAQARLSGRPMLRALERTAALLPAMRAALDRWHSPAVLHGDVHASNAAVRRDGEVISAVLFDWGRARIGSPIEDVSSWLQSVGYWDPEVKNRHDSLLRNYLRARRLPDCLTPEIRQLYWIAAARNGMAGAIRYHLAVLLDPARPDSERCAGSRALLDWLRIIRRADAYWRS